MSGFFEVNRKIDRRIANKWIDQTEGNILEAIRQVMFHLSFSSAKVQRQNEELHKTNAYLAEQARATERAMERARHRR